ncbi:MAG: hypothetical protein KatS3mg008_0213 [Acidimicrobiales bacterium]|nr:MAG: hypothetical protein KatS3mg008_0213 [Acidimicrobiales bacterium]
MLEQNTRSRHADEDFRGDPRRDRAPEIVVIGAGPAGLTAAYVLAKKGFTCTVLEADDTVGGISRTVERDGWRFDIGGHRFFTKVPEVEALWNEILPEEDFPYRPRLSRIYYRGRFFDYPLRPVNALANLGPKEALLCLLSYLWVRVRPPKDQSNFEGWVAARFGWRLYRIFFKTYTEKVWGVPATSIEADWAAQRIKNLSLGRAVLDAFDPRRGKTSVTSLIDRFRYPRLGPGMMWERCRDLVEAEGSKVLLSSPVVEIRHSRGRVTTVVADTAEGRTEFRADHVISSMPLAVVPKICRPAPPDEVRAAASRIRYRDFLTVALVVPADDAFPDNWIYVHSPEVRLGRIQNFGAWSPDMVKPGWTCLGLEYFVSMGDELWEMPDDQLVDFAKAELASLGLVSPARVKAGYVVRMPKAYPTYDEGYKENVAVIRDWIETALTNFHPVGRNGMHRYNNQDHSMLTAMLSVENIFGADHDVWSVNVEEDYHEEVRARPRGSRAGTGRDAPVFLSRHPRGDGA